MKCLLFSLGVCVALSIAAGYAEETTKSPTAERLEGPRDRNIFRTPETYALSHDRTTDRKQIGLQETASFMPTDHVGPGALSFMLGKWQGSVDGESWEEVWSENKDRTVLLCLRTTQDKNGIVDFAVCVVRAGKHGGTAYWKKLSPMLIEESRDPWMGGIGQENSNSAYLDLNLHSEDSAVKDRQKLEYIKKSKDLVVLKVSRNQQEKVIELQRSAIQESP